KYLQKAIVEINDLAHEVAQAGGNRVPVMGSGHPLADIVLLKHRPQAAEGQEGVAFYGRAGQAILKSLQRLHVDPMSVYGTNCVRYICGAQNAPSTRCRSAGRTASNSPTPTRTSRGRSSRVSSTSCSQSWSSRWERASWSS